MLRCLVREMRSYPRVRQEIDAALAGLQPTQLRPAGEGGLGRVSLRAHRHHAVAVITEAETAQTVLKCMGLPADPPPVAKARCPAFDADPGPTDWDSDADPSDLRPQL